MSKSAALLGGGGPENGENSERPFLLFNALLDLGDGFAGFRGTLHGGAVGPMLDEAMCAAATNQTGECPRPLFCLPPSCLAACRDVVVVALAEETDNILRVTGAWDADYAVTATMGFTFLKPVKVPGIVLVRSRVVKKDGRKIFVRGAIEDGDGEIAPLECDNE
ncbi:hypothetical protein VTK26DRAFT_2826 [Humicola hyalothermophila]